MKQGQLLLLLLLLEACSANARASRNALLRRLELEMEKGGANCFTLVSEHSWPGEGRLPLVKMQVLDGKWSTKEKSQDGVKHTCTWMMVEMKDVTGIHAFLDKYGTHLSHYWHYFFIVEKYSGNLFDHKFFDNVVNVAALVSKDGGIFEVQINRVMRSEALKDKEEKVYDYWLGSRFAGEKCLFPDQIRDLDGRMLRLVHDVTLM